MSDMNTKAETAASLVKKHMWAATAIALVPLPWVGMGALTALQLKMLHGLSRLYEVEFSKERGTSIIAALIGGGGAASVSANVGSLFRSIPLFGLIQTLGAATLYGASTYAVGQVFVQHFESGGTFLNLDPKQVRQYYAEEFAAGKTELGGGKRTYDGMQP
jgi:uncharacterized protein (DUF697 family)